MGVLKLIAGALFICWIGVAVFVYLKQDSIIYQAPPPDAMAETRIMETVPGVDVFFVTTPDGQTLSGWILQRKSGRGPAPVLVYFGGNAEDVGNFISDYKTYPGVTLVAVNYRGYGRSTGIPTEDALKDDSLVVYDAALARAGGRGMVMGRSLGSALAVHVAANRDVAAAILVSPFDSLLSVAQNHFPFLPVQWLLHDKWDVLDDAGRADVPALFVAADQDEVVPMQRSRALYDAWKNTDKKFVEVPLAGHNDMEQFSRYKQAMAEYLTQQGG